MGIYTSKEILKEEALFMLYNILSQMDSEEIQRLLNELTSEHSKYFTFDKYKVV